MKTIVSYLATDTNFTIFMNGKHKVVTITNKQHRKLLIEAARKLQAEYNQENLDYLESIISPVKRAILESNKRLEISENGQLFLVGTFVPIWDELAARILDFINDNLPVEPYLNFWESCLMNPSMQAVKELFAFTEENHLPLMEDGSILGYKMLTFKEETELPEEFSGLFYDTNGQLRRPNGQFADIETKRRYSDFVATENNPIMVDSYSKSVRQKVGDIVDWNTIYPNNPVDFTDRRECSGNGFHVGSFDYTFYGDVRVLCKVFPEHVINANVGQSKFRTTKYQIVSFIDTKTEIKEKLIQFKERKKAEKEELNQDFYDLEEDYYDSEFAPGDIAICNTDSYDILTNGKSYYVIDAEEDGFIKILNDKGEFTWCFWEDFDKKW